MKLAVIATTGEIKIAEVTDSHKFLQDHIEGYFTLVAMDGYDVYVSDEGLLLGLPYNPIASALAGGQYLFGDAVLTGGCDSNGETIGLTDDILEALKPI